MNSNSFSKESFHFSKWQEKITAFPKDNKFTSVVNCNGTSPEKSSTIFIPYSETEEVGNIHVNFFDAVEKKIQKDSVMVFNNPYSGNIFYQNLRAYHFQVPITPVFSYGYTKTSQELFFLAALDLNPMSVSDTVEYEVRVPKGYVLLYKPCNIDSTIQLKSDSSIEDKFICYYFTSINHAQEKSDEAKRRGSSRCFLKVFPAIKTIVVPQSEKFFPEESLSRWCLKLYSSVPELSKKTLASIKGEIGLLKDTDTLIKSIFRFVQTKIKYIDIENGMNAFKPRDPNMVFENKQGDCKDMSFLLHSILKEYGIQSYMTLSASISYSFDMDFPSIASANHSICTVLKHGVMIFLDATENECEYGLPSVQIQGKHVLILGKDMAKYVYVNPVSASNNESAFNISFHVGKTLSDGKFTYRFNHSSASLYKNLFADFNKKDFEINIKEVFKDFAAGCDHELSSTVLSDSSICFSGTLAIPYDVMNSFSSQSYFALDFFPYLDWLPKINKITDPLICYSTLNKNSTAEFAFNTPVHLKNARTKKFDENGFIFELSISQIDSTNITARVQLIYNDVTITENRLESYRKMILFITSELSKGIVYE